MKHIFLLLSALLIATPCTILPAKKKKRSARTKSNILEEARRINLDNLDKRAKTSIQEKSNFAKRKLIKHIKDSQERENYTVDLQLSRLQYETFSAVTSTLIEVLMINQYLKEK